MLIYIIKLMIIYFQLLYNNYSNIKKFQTNKKF